MWLGAVLVAMIALFQGPVFAQEVSLPESIDFGQVNVGEVKTAELVITHTANTQVRAEITFNSGCSDLSLVNTSNPLIIPAGQTGSVFVQYVPTEGGPCTTTMEIMFWWVQPFGEVPLGDTPTIVTITGEGLAPEEPEIPVADMESIMAYFDASVADGTLKGQGHRKFAKFRLKMLRKLLVIADRRIEQGRTEQACRMLNLVLKKIDGKSGHKWKKDMVKGPATPELANMVSQMITELGCP